jgi:lipopolysaccharide export system protein LptC
MNVTPLPLSRPPPNERGDRLMNSTPRRGSIGDARRRLSVRLFKRLLPVVALGLLSLVALWPELGHDDRTRFGLHVRGLEPQTGQLTDVHYNGVDDRNRPYTMTASTAHQVSPERVNLTDPKGDVSLDGGAWLMSQARRGVYAPHDGQLDLTGDVVLYRDDGLTLITDAATIDLHAGAATGSERVHVEGPFGTLDAQGFALTDRGGVIQFAGPGRMVLNGARRNDGQRSESERSDDLRSESQKTGTPK